ncbi:hypothetical protein SAMN04490243_0796 [Robiginitalea myxolifaciens]|uniref:Lipoprotein n=1 Tax=Robiginitalea myxolifaciens TaxID=400055 RepID=A0A1I6FW70_9FLAO|nr:hypothetical protein [Robiginitalea myxolifaciens]SFR34215.1 hypothetical protein SAMN04490243_0796 [Robiginitalea myxolifaciens]
MRPILFLSLFLVCILFSCDTSDDDPPRSSQCGILAEVNENRWRSANTDGYVIESVMLEGDCLEITLAASGCDGESWEARLFDAAAIAESLPPQRDVRIDFSNPELCDAFLQRTFVFDLSRLRVSSNSVFLNLDGWEDQILYEY